MLNVIDNIGKQILCTYVKPTISRKKGIYHAIKDNN